MTDVMGLAQDLADRVEREVELRLLERGFAEDMAQHPELPRPMLTADLDQHLVHERVKAVLYDVVVQHLADVTLHRMEAKGIPAQACGVCALKGWRSHE